MFLGVFFASGTVGAGGAGAGAGEAGGAEDVPTVSVGTGGQEVNTKHRAKRQERTFAFMQQR